MGERCMCGTGVEKLSLDWIQVKSVFVNLNYLLHLLSSQSKFYISVCKEYSWQISSWY